MLFISQPSWQYRLIIILFNNSSLLRKSTHTARYFKNKRFLSFMYFVDF
jgi:hypothetical protein